MNTEKLDVVWVTGPDRPKDSLRYSMRSVEANMPHRNMFVFGSPPEYVSGGAAFPVEVHPDKWHNINRQIREASVHPGVSEPFIFMNDDMFITKYVDDLEPAHQGPAKGYIEYLRAIGKNPANDWFAAVRRTFRDLSELVVLPLAYECHQPLIVSKLRFHENARSGWVPGTAYDLYRAYGTQPYQGVDVKVAGREMEDWALVAEKEPRFLSTSERSWQGFTGAYIRRRFPVPSSCEVDQ